MIVATTGATDDGARARDGGRARERDGIARTHRGDDLRGLNGEHVDARGNGARGDARVTRIVDGPCV
jgi:hypothetical protein